MHRTATVVLAVAKEAPRVISMDLNTVIAKGRALFISPYTNFNLILGLNIAQRIASSDSPVYILTNFSINPLALEIIEVHNRELVRLVEDLDSAPGGGTLIAIVEVVDNGIYSPALSKFSDFFIFAHRISIPRSCCNMYKIRRINTIMYSIQSNSSILLVKVIKNKVYEVEVPEEVARIVKELKEIVMAFGSVKAGDFIKYLSRKYGYGRNECLNLLRHAIAIGVIKYHNGYLYA